MDRLLPLVLLAALVALPRGAAAWSRAGHMVSAAIAFEDLAARDATLIDRVAEIIARHPDRGAFEVAVGASEGRDRALRLFMQCARWPDDARGTVYDHPTWHYADRPVIRPGTPNPGKRRAGSGQAIQALELNLRVAANPHATPAERAVALCWVMHVAVDMHQPLHAASLHSATFPEGDAGGTRQFVVDPDKPEPVSLHWFWDDCVQRDDAPGAAIARAIQIAGRYARASLPELRERAARRWTAWAYEESYPLAAAQAYPPGLSGGLTRETAVALPAGYAERTRAVAERRIAVAGYRLSDLLREVAAEREGLPR